MREDSLEYCATARPGKDHSTLARNLPAGRPTKRLLRDIMKERCALAGAEGEFSAHSLRAGLVAEAGRQNMSLPETMAMTGHHSVATVMGYSAPKARSAARSAGCSTRMKFQRNHKIAGCYDSADSAPARVVIKSIGVRHSSRSPVPEAMCAIARHTRPLSHQV